MGEEDSEGVFEIVFVLAEDTELMAELLNVGLDKLESVDEAETVSVRVVVEVPFGCLVELEDVVVVKVGFTVEVIVFDICADPVIFMDPLIVVEAVVVLLLVIEDVTVGLDLTLLENLGVSVFVLLTEAEAVFVFEAVGVLDFFVVAVLLTEAVPVFDIVVVAVVVLVINVVELILGDADADGDAVCVLEARIEEV